MSSSIDSPAKIENARVTLAVAGLVTVAVAWLLLWPFWPFRNRLLDLGKIVHYSWWAAGVWVLGLVLWVGCLQVLAPFLRGQTWRGAPVPLSLVTGFVMTAFVAMYPVSAIDVYIYAARSRLFSHYGENPNAVQPATHWDTDPFVHFASKEWADNLSPYGPLWNLIAAPVTWLSGTHIGLAVVGYKLIAAGALVSIGALIYDTVKRAHPEWAVLATLLWLWNPFVLWDGLANAHNDVVMMVPIVLALRCWQRNRPTWVIPLLVVSILVKYIALLLLPLAVVGMVSRYRRSGERLRIGIASTLGSIGIAVLSLAPFFDPASLWASFSEQGARFSPTPAWTAAVTWRTATGQPANLDAVQMTAMAITVGIMAALCVRVWRDPDTLGACWFEALCAFCLIASTNQRPWYTLWLVPLAAMLVPGYRWIRAVGWSGSSMAAYVGQIYLWYVWDFDRFGSTPYRLILVAVMFGPVIVAWMIEVWLARTQVGRREQASPGAVAIR